MIKEADWYCNLLYSYRSVSKALPMVDTKLKEEEKIKIYHELFEVAAPQIDKIKQFQIFHDKCVKFWDAKLLFCICGPFRIFKLC